MLGFRCEGSVVYTSTGVNRSRGEVEGRCGLSSGREEEVRKWSCREARLRAGAMREGGS